MTPAPMRGQATALYTGILNMIGFGVGPLLVALLTDNLFADPGLLKYSMVVVLVISIVIALAVLVRTSPHTGPPWQSASAGRRSRRCQR